MKCSKAAICRRIHRLPEVRCKDQCLISFSGLVLFQPLFRRLGLKEQLTGCFLRLKVGPTRRQAGNRVYILPAIVAHNLSREMQLLAHAPARRTTERRAPPWCFEQFGALRRKLIRRAKRSSKSEGALTLTMSASPAVKSVLLYHLGALQKAA